MAPASPPKQCSRPLPSVLGNPTYHTLSSQQANTISLGMSDEWLSAKAIDCWWASPTQKGIRRPYGPKSVVALRDPFPENIAANAMALRLRAVLEKHHRARTINLTTSPLEMSSQQMMAEAGMETAYVSGGLASFTAVDDPSSDHVCSLAPGVEDVAHERQADYPYDTLPQKVALLHRAQLMNARIARSKGRAGHDACMLPLIADADSGYVPAPLIRIKPN